MELSPIRFDTAALDDYAALFKVCFPQSAKFSPAYLAWLYCSNPAGPAIGYDARDGARLAAHYVCIPWTAMLEGRQVRALLSLNTATHPDYQGRGLFTRLAQLTYADGAHAGMRCVCGVANANSTPGFIRKLGFTLIEPLQAAIGGGRLSAAPMAVAHRARLRRAWDNAALAWRCANPVNPVHLRIREDRLQCSAGSIGPLLRAYAELPSTDFPLPIGEQPGTAWLVPRLYLGLIPGQGSRLGNYLPIARRLRPSPLNFIFRPLSDDIPIPEQGETSLSFLDFDAY